MEEEGEEAEECGEEDGREDDERDERRAWMGKRGRGRMRMRRVSEDSG